MNSAFRLVRYAALASPLMLAVLASSGGEAHAQEDAPPSIDTRVGQATDGLVGLARVGVPRAAPFPVNVSIEAGYGFTESVLNLDDSHHRFSGRFAAAVQPVEFFAVGLRLDGRYDSHSVSGMSDDGLVGDPRLFLRGFTELGDLSLGAEVTLFIPGQDAPSFPLAALTVDAEAMLGYRATPDLTFALNAGYRLDQTEETIEPGVRYSPGDQLALGISSSDAILLGLGGAYRLGEAEIFAEFTWDLLTGSMAPSATESPMRAGLGGRFWVGETHDLQITARAEIGLSSRPTAPVSFVPIEPRFSVFAGLAYRFPAPDVASGAVVPDSVDQEDPENTDDPEGEERDVTGSVLDPAGEPLSGVQVELLEAGDVIATESTDEDGAYTFEDAPSGELVVRVQLDGFAPFESTVTAGAMARVQVSLERELPSGQVRGVVQSFGGNSVQATIRVLPLDEEATANEEGFFEVNVPPGTYEVVITADGYREQRRPVTVEEQGVTILNVDLRRE